MGSVFGVDLVRAAVGERIRQVQVEGFNEFHDAGYTHEELLRAAACYLLGQHLFTAEAKNADENNFEPIWPWSNANKWPISRMQKKDKLTRMKMAIALIMAEADRLQLSGELGRNENKVAGV